MEKSGLMARTPQRIGPGRKTAVLYLDVGGSFAFPPYFKFVGRAELRQDRRDHIARGPVNRHLAIVFSILLWASGAVAANDQWLPTGQTITPLAAPGSRFDPLSLELPTVGRVVAGQAVTTALSADGRTLFVLTSGYNIWKDSHGKKIPEASTEHLFVFDVSAGMPVLHQVLDVPNAFGGLAVTSHGDTAFVSGGVDDSILVFARSPGGDWSRHGKPWKLTHSAGNAVVPYSAVLKPATAGLALTADGNTLVIANYQNDSVTLVGTSTVTSGEKPGTEIDLRPGKIDPAQIGVPGGEFPYWVATKGNDTAYVSSVRDREVVVIHLADKPKITARLKIRGNPTRLLLNRDQSRLFVAEDNSDRVEIFDTTANTLVASVATTILDRPGISKTPLPGGSPNGLALSPDERTLYATDGGANAVSVISLDGAPKLLGLIPTAWQPNSLSVSADGKLLYIANGKSPSGSNPRNCMKTSKTTPRCSEDDQAGAANQYVYNLSGSGLQTVPVPSMETLGQLTAQVARNNGFGESLTQEDRQIMSALHQRIKHVIYIVRENRTFDQILGDLPGVDGDPTLVQFDANTTPNAHKLARDFVAFDSFFDSGDVSGDGWAWSTSARTTDAVEKQIPVNYGDRGMTYDEEGTSRGINVALPMPQRIAANPLADKDPDLLPGPANETAPDGPNGEFQQGYLWNAALRAKLSTRNYGFFLDIDLYFPQAPSSQRIPLERDPATKALRVAFPANPDLAPLTDIYFRGFDNSFPDYWRFREWAREFDSYCENGRLPAFETVRFMHDHTGDFSTAIDGVNTPETQIADNDYAVGLLIEKIAKSRYASDTLVFVIEDDAQDGPDHVDAHRSVAFIAGPYVKHRAVVSERYTTVSMIRTIEEILGLSPLNLHDAHVRPMTAAFDLKAAKWSYRAQVPAMLRTTTLPLPALPNGAAAVTVKPAHDSAYWSAKMKGFDFTAEDRLDTASYNRILWEGLKGGQPYPTLRSGETLRPSAPGVVPSENYIRQYRLCSPPRISRATMRPWHSIGRWLGESFPKPR
jgi:DNA-binding beta-propeller fold protein YncE